MATINTPTDLASGSLSHEDVRVWGILGDYASLPGLTTYVTTGYIDGSGFDLSMVGKTVSIPGAGSGGSLYVGTIIAYVSPTRIDISPNTTLAVTTDGFIGTDNHDALDSLVNTTLESGTVVFSPGDYYVGTSVSFPDTIKVRFESGAKLIVASGATVTLSGPIVAENHQIFDVSLGGFVSFTGNSSLDPLNPKWWGAVGNGISDDTVPIQKAIDAAEDLFDSRILSAGNFYSGISVHLPAGIYKTTASLEISRPIAFRGDGIEMSVLKGTGDAAIIHIENGVFITYMAPTLENFGIFGDLTKGNQDGVLLDYNPSGTAGDAQAVLRHLAIEFCGRDGFRSSDKGNSNRVEGCVIQANARGGIHLMGVYNTNPQIIGNIIRDNKAAITIQPNVGSSFATGNIRNNLIESNTRSDDAGSEALGDGHRPGTGIYLQNCSFYRVEGNYFEAQLADIYLDGGCAFNTFANNHHDQGSNKLAKTYETNGALLRQIMPVYLTGTTNYGNIFSKNDFYQPKKPSNVKMSTWGLSYVNYGITGNVTAGNTTTPSITLTAGDVAAMGLLVGDYIQISGVVGITGLDYAPIKIQNIAGEVITLADITLDTMETYTSGGTVLKVKVGTTTGVTLPDTITLNAVNNDVSNLSISAGKYIKLVGSGGMTNLDEETFRVVSVDGQNVKVYAPANWKGTYSTPITVMRVSDGSTPEATEEFPVSIGTQTVFDHNIALGPDGSLREIRYISDPNGNIYSSSLRKENDLNRHRDIGYSLERSATQDIRDKAARWDEESNTTGVALHRIIWPYTLTGTDFSHWYIPEVRSASGTLGQPGVPAAPGSGWAMDKNGNFCIPFQGKVTYQRASGDLITQDFGAAAPTTTGATYRIGSFRRNTAPSAGSNQGWFCTDGGTVGTLSGSVTGSITGGTNSLVVSDASNLLVGQFLDIATVTPTGVISAISGTTVTLVTTSGGTYSASGTVTSQAVSFHNPTFLQTGIVSNATNIALLDRAGQTFTQTNTFPNLIDSGLTANALVYGNGSKQLSSVTITAPLDLTAGTLSMHVADSTHNGYLSSTDWSTFNSKLSSYTETDPLSLHTSGGSNTMGQDLIMGTTHKVQFDTDQLIYNNANDLLFNNSGGKVWIGASGNILLDTAGNLEVEPAMTSSTVGVTGGASALPALPVGYLKLEISGTVFKIPYYNS